MLIPSFCSIARKGIRELDTTEKENHHGEKDYAFFHAVPFPTPPALRRAQGKNFQIETRRSKGYFESVFAAGQKHW